jgi:hypothetical protein
MKKGVEVRLGPGERERLEAVVGSRNSPQKHVWRARIVLLSADRVGTMAIQRQIGKSKPTIWRWQERFTAAGVDGLLRDATRPGRKKRLPAATIERVVAMTLGESSGGGHALDRSGNGQGCQHQPSQRAAVLAQI